MNSKYTISIKDHKENFKSKASLEYQEKSKIHQLKPLLLIILYITTASILLHYNNWSWDEFMLDFMGLFFIVFSFFISIIAGLFPTKSMFNNGVIRLLAQR